MSKCENCGIGIDLHGAVCGGTDQPSPPDAGPGTTVQGCCLCGDTDDTYPCSNGRRYCECCRCKRCGCSPPDGNTCLCDYMPRPAPPEPASRQGEPLSDAVKMMLAESVQRQTLPSPKYPVPNGYVIVAKKWIERVAEGIAAIEDTLAAAERERDELRRENVRLGAQVDAWRISSDEAIAKLARCAECGGSNGVDPLCDDCYCRDVDEATAKERARCLEIVETYEPRRDVPGNWNYQGALARISDRIRNGTPAPKGPTE